jgi:hypothetical protein
MGIARSVRERCPKTLGGDERSTAHRDCRSAPVANELRSAPWVLHCAELYNMKFDEVLMTDVVHQRHARQVLLSVLIVLWPKASRDGFPLPVNHFYRALIVRALPCGYGDEPQPISNLKIKRMVLTVKFGHGS